MYAGSTLTKMSGRILGAHQKIDRVARKHLAHLIARGDFPTIRRILRFEGKDGPDGIKRKSPAVNEPWHYYNPFDASDVQLVDLINSHYQTLVDKLRAGDDVRVAFEAAWLAHAIVDGLTPAHHYPYEEKLTELRGGASILTRTTVKSKLILPGETRRLQLSNNWKMWGPKGLFTTHGLFEMGVATLILPLSLKRARPTADDIEEFQRFGVAEWFRRTAKEIAAMNLYEEYYKAGWTPKLARKVSRKLAPTIVRTVTLTWYGALEAAKVRA